jgi:hypothetical protein
MVNLYPELVPQGGKEPAFLSRAPGLRLRLTLGTGPVRGMLVVGGFLYAVSGSRLYKVSTSYVITDLGVVAGSNPVSMASNGTQIFIAADGPSYIYNNQTFVFQQITDPDFPGASVVGYLDSYFVFVEPNTQKVWVTDFLDGTAIDPTEFASAEGAPDNLVSLIVDHREAWLFGSDSVEVFYNSGGVDFPLTRIQGAFLEIGCVARHSVAKLDNSVFWLGGDARGQGIVYRATGYTGVRVSNHALEWQIQSYGDISDAIAYTYQQDGHPFYVLTFPTASKTWVFDVSTNEWCERAYFSLGQYSRHRSNCQVVFNSLVLVGDYENGKVYSFDKTVYTDDGQPQRWLRSWRALPPGRNNLKRTVQHELQLDCEAGVGLTTGQGQDPQVMLRWSDDGGHTWSNEHPRSMGRIGDRGLRVIWRRLGMTTKLRDRVYEVSGADPVKIAIMGAELTAGGTVA